MRFVDRHRFKPKPAKGYLAAAAGAVLLTCTEVPAPAQSRAAADRALTVKLLERGFTKADLDALDLAKVTPHFERFSQWRRCAQAAVGRAVANAGARNSARELAKLFCAESADAVSASLGQELGVTRAARVRKLLDALLDDAVDAQWSELEAQTARTDVRPLTKTVQIGRWTITPTGSGCMAQYMPANGASPRVAVSNDGRLVQLWLISGNDAIDAHRTPPIRELTITGPSGSEHFLRAFQEGIVGDTRWLRTSLSDDVAAALADAREIVIQDRGARSGSMAAVAERFAIEPVEPILPTIRHC